MKVYIVDESILIRDLLKAMLVADPEVEIIGEADNPHDAAKDLFSLNPDVVIMDMRRPLGDGLDTIEKIKNTNSPPVVIVWTNYSLRQYREKCMDSGADFFFDKSNEFEKIPEVLEQLSRDSRVSVREG